MDKELNTPVLFLIFNRPDTTKLVFEAIRKARPKQLFIAADGPQLNKANEKKKVQAAREIASNVDWDCEVKELFQDRNLGCKIAVSSAIDWFFENVEEGIILEDDCLPSHSFFLFCEELLCKYKSDMRIWQIGGYKYPYLEGDEYSYNFSRFTHIWGWASWADRWKYYDVNLSKFTDYPNILTDYEFFTENYEIKLRTEILKKVSAGEINTWDYQWNFTVRINNGLSIRPKINLVRNIGFEENGTHTLNKDAEIRKNIQKEIIFPLKHPNFVMVYKKDDDHFSKTNIDCRFISKLKKLLWKNKLIRAFS